MEGFELISTAIVSDIIPIRKYRSKATGITVCIANVDGPLVNGYFCLGECKVFFIIYYTQYNVHLLVLSKYKYCEDYLSCFVFVLNL